MYCGGKPEHYIRVANVLLIATIFSLAWRPLHIRGITAIPIPVSELLAVAIGFVLAVCAVRASLPYAKELFAILKKRYWFLVILLMAPLLGLLGSSFSGFAWQEYALRAAIDYALLLFALFFFAVTTYLVFIHPRILKSIFITIAVSSIPFWVALHDAFSPFFIALRDNRLRGAASGPNEFAGWIALGLTISIVFFLWEDKKSRWWWLANACVIAPLFLWTASRAAWLVAASASLVVGILFLKEQFSRKRIILLGIMSLSLLISLVFGFLVMPAQSRVVTATRVASPFVNSKAIPVIAHSVAEGVFIPKIEVPPNNRTQLWIKGASAFLRSPLGFGPTYYLWNPVTVTISEDKLGAHDTWIDVGLIGGWIGFAVWVYFMITMGRGALRLAQRREPQLIVLAASFFVLLLLSFFFDMLYVRWLWLAIGMIAAEIILKDREKPSLLTYEEEQEK